MANASILKKGYLYQFRIKQEVSDWERQYFVLHGQSSRNEARLDWYESRESSLSNPGLRSGIFLEEISRVERITNQSKVVYGPSAVFLFGIYTCRKDEPYVMKCKDAEMLNGWLKMLSQLLLDVKRTKREKAKTQTTVYSMHNTPQSLTFAREADVEETAAAKRQGIRGRYRIVLSRQHLSLTNPDDPSTVLFWHYSHVRRFGYSDRTFTIEGGQRSGPGEGLFILKNCEGHALFNEVQDKIRLLKQSCQEVPKSPSPPGPRSRNAACLQEDDCRDYRRWDNLPNLKGTPRDEPVKETALQQSDSGVDDDEDEDSSGSEDTSDGGSSPGNRKPKIPPKNFDLGSPDTQIDLPESPPSFCSSTDKKKTDRAKTKGHQSRADKVFRGSSIIQFGPFKRFMSPPPPDAEGQAVGNSSDFDQLPLMRCWDEVTNSTEDAAQVCGSPVKPHPPPLRMGEKSSSKHPTHSEKKPFWTSVKGKNKQTVAGRELRPVADATFRDEESEEDGEPPPPVKPKNFQREDTANNDEDLVLVIPPSLPSRPKSSAKKQSNPKRKPDKTSSTVKTQPVLEASPKKLGSSTPMADPDRYVRSHATALQNDEVVEPTTEDVQMLSAVGPKISEVLLYLETKEVESRPGDNVIDDLTGDESEGAYNRIDLRSLRSEPPGAAGKGRIIHGRDADDEHHLYGQSLICQMVGLQRVEDEPTYEDVVFDPNPRKNSKKAKK